MNYSISTLSNMRDLFGLCCPALIMSVTALPAHASPPGSVTPTTAEMRLAGDWSRRHIEASGANLPFSFTYGGASSGSLIGNWPNKSERKKLDAARIERIRTWTDPASGLRVRCTAVTYTDFPAVEWTVTLRNTGTKDSPVLEDIQGLSATFERGAQGEFLLHGNQGDYCAAESYEPYDITLTPGIEKHYAPPGSGKSCDGPDGWPYFNLQSPTGGTILAVGWPGQWAASFTRDQASGLRVRAGQQLTHLTLHPGEEIRTPLIALVFWSGSDLVRSQNLWRRWYSAHNLPRTKGVAQGAISQIQVDGSVGNIASVQATLDAGIKPDICWRDAAWYINSGGPYKGNDAWLNTGTWDIDPTRYPQGFRPFSDWVRLHGMQFLLWFEPERVGDPNSWLGRNHPEWLLPGSSHGPTLDLGNPDALKWLTDHVDSMIKTQGLDWYREDMNGVGPGPAWRQHDAPDRQGMTENLYVQGHLAFWDELRRRNPGLRIDSCASGGRRNDLETMRRAVLLLRSDFQFPSMKGVVEGNQAHTFGLSSWLPFQGSGCYYSDMYALRSFYLPGFGTFGNGETARKAYSECAQVGPLMMADYYPLTSYSRTESEWIGWQFNRPESGTGVVQVFRRPGCKEGGRIFHLSSLDPAANYVITDLDSPGMRTATGKSLMSEGLMVEIPAAPGAAVLLYKKAP